jgi:hypothetical protein
MQRLGSAMPPRAVVQKSARDQRVAGSIEMVFILAANREHLEEEEEELRELRRLAREAWAMSDASRARSEKEVAEEGNARLHHDMPSLCPASSVAYVENAVRDADSSSDESALNPWQPAQTIPSPRRRSSARFASARARAIARSPRRARLGDFLSPVPHANLSGTPGFDTNPWSTPVRGTAEQVPKVQDRDAHPVADCNLRDPRIGAATASVEKKRGVYEDECVEKTCVRAPEEWSVPTVAAKHVEDLPLVNARIAASGPGAVSLRPADLCFVGTSSARRVLERWKWRWQTGSLQEERPPELRAQWTPGVC